MLEVFNWSAGIVGTVFVIFSTGLAFGRKSNGYVKQKTCDDFRKSVNESQAKLHEKVNKIAIMVARIDERTGE